MTTCPDCRRPVATASAYVAGEGGLGAAWDGAVCYVAIDGYDAYCADLAADLRAKADAALLDLARAIPPRALAELARVLRYGGAKHGAAANEPSADQTAEDHVTHARGHNLCASGRATSRDSDTGALDTVHEAARALLAAELVLKAEELGK